MRILPPKFQMPTLGQGRLTNSGNELTITYKLKRLPHTNRYGQFAQRRTLLTYKNEVLSCNDAILPHCQLISLSRVFD